MDAVLIEEPRRQAREKFLEYREAVRSGRATVSDETLMEAYRALARGKTVIDLHQTIVAAGLDLRRRPLLAVARADKALVRFGYVWSDNRPRFYDPNMRPGYDKRASKAMNCFALHHGALGHSWREIEDFRARPAQAIVPTIPPALRPGRTMLRKYAILWEAEWESAPVDPILLSPIRGKLFAVVAQWDLTPLEQAALMP